MNEEKWASSPEKNKCKTQHRQSAETLLKKPGGTLGDSVSQVFCSLDKNKTK